MRHFHELLPVDGHTFHTSCKGRWRAKVWLWPSLRPGQELLRYQILFRQLPGPAHRVLKLWVSRRDLDLPHCRDDVLAYLTLWLESEEGNGECTVRWDEARQILSSEPGPPA